MALTIMTYNIRLGIQQGLDAIASVVTPHTPDILALQEVGDYWTMGPEGPSTSTLSELCDLPHAHHVAALVDGTHHYGHALLSKHPFDVVAQIELPQHKDEPRVLLHTIVHAPEQDVHVLSTHLSWIEDRAEQGKILADKVNELTAQGHTVMIMGDLNEHEPVDWLSSLLAQCEDADQELERLTFPSKKPRIRIDYLLCTKGRWEDPRVIEEREASDHLPLVARWHGEG